MLADTATLISSDASCCEFSMLLQDPYGSYNKCLRGPTCRVEKHLPDFTFKKVAEADFPTRFGRFRIYGFEAVRSTQTEEAVALKIGELSSRASAPLVRIHSQCLTGDVFHSLRCDCRAQLELALDQIVAESRGLLIYENQEGRGIGLLNKLRAYELQDRGLDTVEANEHLGFDADLRDYALPAAILNYFKVTEVRLLSNNPEKVAALENAGIKVVERAPIIVPPLETTVEYLRTKREKLGHLL
jgi:GTP cyclohydrolase II